MIVSLFFIALVELTNNLYNFCGIWNFNIMKERNVIYRFQYREGEDLEIWQYAEKDTFGDTFQKQVDLFEKRSIIKKSSWED